MAVLYWIFLPFPFLGLLSSHSRIFSCCVVLWGCVRLLVGIGGFSCTPCCLVPRCFILPSPPFLSSFLFYFTRASILFIETGVHFIIMQFSWLCIVQSSFQFWLVIGEIADFVFEVGGGWRSCGFTVRKDRSLLFVREQGSVCVLFRERLVGKAV